MGGPMRKPDLLLADALAMLTQNSDVLPWEKRRTIAWCATEALQSGCQSKLAIQVADLLVDDATWEVRQAVAELLVYLPDGAQFNCLAGRLAQDCNGFVL